MNLGNPTELPTMQTFDMKFSATRTKYFAPLEIVKMPLRTVKGMLNDFKSNHLLFLEKDFFSTVISLYVCIAKGD